MSSEVSTWEVAVVAMRNPQKISEEAEQLLFLDWWELLKLSYLMIKHRSSCVFVPRVLASISRKEYEKLSTKNLSDFVLTWRCMDRVERTFVNQQTVNPLQLIKPPNPYDILGNDIKCQLTASYAFRVSMELYLAFLKDCMRNKCVHIGVYDIKHANMMVYDSEKHKLERFEPYSQLSPLEYNPTGLDMRLIKFDKQLDKNVSYIPPSQICTVNGLQTIESATEQILGTGLQIGSCSIWTLLYTDLRLSKHDIS